MRKEIREVGIGAAAIALLAILLGGSYGGGASKAESRIGQNRLLANFNRVDGLRTGDPVMLSGVPVGAVGSMSLVENFRARVALLVDAGVDLPRDTAAAIHTDGLFGTKFVSLSPGAEEDLLGDGDAIAYTQDALIVSDLLDLIIAQGRSARGLDDPAETSESAETSDSAEPAAGN